MIRKWCIFVAVILVLGTAALAGVRGMQPAKAATSVPLYLGSIEVYPIGPHYTSFHRGDKLDLEVFYEDMTGQAVSFTAHPAVYHSRYRLLDIAIPSTSWACQCMQYTDWQVTIPKNAPLGTYKYWFTLGVYGFLNQTLMTTFKVIN